MPTPIFFNQFLISMNFYQQGKNQPLSSFYSRNIFDLKILQSDWLRAFWAIYQELEFSQIWDLSKHRVININFIIDQIEKKLITKFACTSQRTLDLVCFPHFRDKILFSKNLAMSCTTPHGHLTPCWFQEKTKELVSRKLLDRTDRPYL